MRASIPFLLLWTALGFCGCQREPSPPPTPPPAAPREPPKPAKLELPELEPPTLGPAERVVDLFFSSNVAGEVEPCG